MVTIMNTRLKQFLAAENISQSQFADTIKVVRASVSHVLAGRNKPGYDFIKAIMSTYPHLNMEWLIMGKGKMYKSAMEQPLPPQQQPSVTTIQEEEMPLLFDYDQEGDVTSEDMPSEPYATPSETRRPQNEQIPPAYFGNTINNNPQPTDRQRKAVRIVVFYNDGTYQEFQNI